MKHIPSSEFFIMENGNPIKKNTLEFFKDKKIVLFGLPGAYTSVCSAKHLPGYVESYEQYKAKGIDHIALYFSKRSFRNGCMGQKSKCW